MSPLRPAGLTLPVGGDAPPSFPLPVPLLVARAGSESGRKVGPGRSAQWGEAVGKGGPGRRLGWAGRRAGWGGERRCV